jgi:hypothetical protein
MFQLIVFGEAGAIGASARTATGLYQVTLISNFFGRNSKMFVIS